MTYHVKIYWQGEFMADQVFSDKETLDKLMNMVTIAGYELRIRRYETSV